MNVDAAGALLVEIPDAAGPAVNQQLAQRTHSGARHPGRCATTRWANCSSSRHWCHFGRLKKASMPTMRHKLRSDTVTQLGEGFHRIRRTFLAHLAVIDHEARLAGDGEFHHFQAQLRIRRKADRGRRIAGGQEANFLQTQPLAAARTPYVSAHSESDRRSRRKYPWGSYSYPA